MRWLFVAVLAILVGCVLSIIWMNDDGQWPHGDSRMEGPQSQPQNPLSPPPGNP
ncbi:hypothetical protein QTA58_02905 [Neorhizobium sp. CSC1952]|uniref:Uncharacterized protein n=1 Tax=Xaviernesmea oryzae TaxID=464029 RepID=A0A1X7F9I0_9HYPH|nr:MULTISPECIES: hypothetical protein [Rhizobium/Agrobacterium group]WJR67734.1 hypothetical protein QTA58_02905 [Rhizobium sp. CSC1952]SMF48148.1 hypothetical protein SAMN02982989_2508 [Xaviernesmea oryzae]